MKGIKKILISILAVIALFAFSTATVACDCNGDTPAETTGYSVTFMVEGTQYGQVVKVQKGKRITKPADPTFSNAGYVFTGWFTSENFAEDTLWDGDVEHRPFEKFFNHNLDEKGPLT